MLSEHENRINLGLLKFFAFFNVFPVEFKGNMIRPASKTKHVTWILLLVTECFRVLLSIWLMVGKVRMRGIQSIPTLTMDYCFIAPPAFGIFAAAQNFFQYSDVTAALWKNFAPTPGLMANQCRNGPVWGYTYLETYTMLVGCAIYPAACTLALACALLYTWPLTEGLNVGFRCACVLLDAALFVSWASWCHCAAVIQIMFMEKLGLVLKSIGVNLRQVYRKFPLAAIAMTNSLYGVHLLETSNRLELTHWSRLMVQYAS